MLIKWVKWYTSAASYETQVLIMGQDKGYQNSNYYFSLTLF